MLSSGAAAPLLLALWVMAPTAYAATFTVNSTTDAVDATPGDGICATAGSVCTLRAATQEANALAGADTINLPNGTYNLTTTGNLLISDVDGVTITGGGQATTIIDGQATYRIFDVSDGSNTFNDLTLRNGNPGSGPGGAIYFHIMGASTQAMNRVTVTGNTTVGQGGGIYCNANPTLNITDAIITNNSTTNGAGGIQTAGTTTITNATITGNSGTSGGGIANSGSLTISNTTISNNTSSANAGGIDNGAGTLVMSNSVISNNSAGATGSGGALDSTGVITLTNVTISTNSSSAGNGGGIHFKGTLNLTNVTLYGNTGGRGIDKIAGTATTSFKNTIIAGNAAGNCSTTFTSAGYNLESATNTCGFTGTGDQNTVTAGNLNIGALASNGGPTQTHALLAGSFAIDRIPNGTNGCGTTITTDQRGTARPQNATCDVGSYELMPAATTTVGDGATPASRNVGRSTTNRAVDAFTLSTSSGTDTLTGLTVTLSGTGAAADILASGVKLWKDNGSVPNEWDATDTQIGSGVSMSGTTATFSGLTEGITTTSTQYLITYDISASATPGNTLLGRVSAATTTNALTNNDTTDNTLTVAAVSGTLYSDEGATVLAGKTVKLVKAGVGGASDTTDAFGRYAITATLAAGNAIIAYIDNDATYDANTVTLAGGTAIAGLDLYAGRVITRCDNACSLTIANMSTALGAYTDAGDLLYSMAGSLTISGTGTAINIPSGHTFAPGAAITVTPAMEVRGTFTAGAFTHTLSGTGTPFVVTGTFTSTGSTIKYTGTTTATTIAATNYNNLQLTPTGATTYSLTGNLTGGNALTGNLTIDANATLDATTANNYNLTGVNVTVNASGTYLAKASTITVSGNWSNAGTFTAGTSTVAFTGTSGTKTITPGGSSFYNITFNDSAGTATYQLQAALTATNDLTVTDGILDTKAGSNFAINVTRDFTQSGGRVLAQSSTVTVGRDFTANGAELETGFNAASLVLTGAGGLTYNNLVSYWTNGFNNLTVGQSGNTTTLNRDIAVINVLTVGTGTFTGTGTNSVYLKKFGAPLVFDAASTVSMYALKFFATSQNIPTLINGYDCNIEVAGVNTTVTQLGAVTINAGKGLYLTGDGNSARIDVYSTAGFALTVGGDIQIGVGGDTSAKTLNGTNSTITVGGNIDIRSGTTTFTNTSSTVILNGTGLQTVLMSGENFNNLTITNASAAGVSFLDAFNAANITGTTAGSKLTFKAGATYGISGTLSLAGTSGSKITLLSDTPASRFTLNPTGAQSVSYVDIKDSQSSTSSITANGATNSGGNDDAEAAPHWIFDSCPVVTSTADSGINTLRSCIAFANSNPGTTISFNIPGPGNQSSGGDSWWRISPASTLPIITANGTIIDGTTQTTNQGNINTLGPEIELRGVVAGNGLDTNASNTTIKGLIINNFSGNGININGSSATIKGCYIGTDYAAATAVANGYGIQLTGNTGAIIGTSVAADRNIISGNTWYGIASGASMVVKNNYIGTNRTGTAAIPNGPFAIYTAFGSNTIGGSGANEGNLISGNNGSGIALWFSSNSNVVKGNRIGTTADGLSSLPNTGYGINIANGASSNTIGGAAVGEGNIIAFNGSAGVLVDNATSDGNSVSGNSIHSNTGLGIDLGPVGVGTGSGANNDKARPTISSISPSGADFTIVATVTSGDTIELFRVNNAAAPAVTVDGSGSGEGYLYLGKCVDNGACSGPHISAVADANAAGGTVQATLLSTGITGGDNVTATGTDATNGTSEFAVNSLVPVPTTTLGDGTTPASRNVGRSTSNRAVDAFTLSTSSGTDTLTGLTVTLSGTGAAADIAASGVKIWKDNGSVPNEWDATDTQIGSGVTMSGTTATFSGLTESITTTSTQYLITYDISAAATPSNTLLGRVSAATTTNALTNNDTTDNTLTVAAVSGTVYTDEGTTSIGAGKTVKLVKAGTGGSSDTTDAFGRYAIPATLAANDAILVYIDNDATYKGSAVTMSNGTSLAGLDIYGNHDIITRHDNGGSLTSANMGTALGAYSDTDIEFTVPAGVLTAVAGTTIYVPAAHTFAPGANTSLDGVKILGTVSGGSYTHTITGTWNATAGTYTAGTSTVSLFPRTSSFYFYPGASSYYNVVFDSHEFFLYLGASFTATGDVTLKTTGAGFGTLTLSNYNITAANYYWQSSYVVAGTGVVSVSGNWSKTGGGYFSGATNIAFTGGGNSTFTPGSGSHGSVTVNKSTQTAVVSLATNNLVMAASKALTITSGIFDIAGRNLDIGAGSTFSNDGTLRLQGGETIANLTNDTNSGTVEYNGGGAYGGLIIGNSYYHLTFNGAGSWAHAAPLTVNGNFTLTAGTVNSGGQNVSVTGNWANTGTYTPGANTVTLNGTNQSISGATTFNNFTKSVASADTLTFAASSTTTINATATINGAAGQLLSLRSGTPSTRWNFNLGASATKAISYVDVQDSDASGSDASKKPILPANSTDSGNTVSWFPAGYTLSGKVFEDANFNGTAADWDSGVSDKALANVDVELYDNSNVYLSSATTDGSGNFSFTGLANGTYKVRVRAATIGDADTTPLGGLNASVPATWPYPLPEMAWGNGTAVYGGVSATVDDTATGDNAGIGDNYVTLAVSGANVSNVNFGFAYNLIVNVDDDGNADTARSKQGSLRQFIKNVNAIGSAGGTTANYSQFRMQVATNQSSGGDAWWRFTVNGINLPAIADGGTTLDGSRQRINSGVDSNTLGPEIEIFGNNARSVGLNISTGSNHTLQELVVNSFTSAGISAGGATVAQVRLYGNYVGTNATGSAALANGVNGVYFWNGGQSDIDIGGAGAGQGNLLSGNGSFGISLAGGNTYRIYGNKIGVDRSGTAALANGNAGIDTQGTTALVTIGGSAAGQGNIISKNASYGISLRATTSSVTIKGNTIGSGITGTESNLGNGNHGIWVITTHATPNVVIGGLSSGEGNLIAYNTQEGIRSEFSSGTGYQILGNTIRNNTWEGISNAWDNVTVSGNAIFSNGTGGTKYDGINVLAAADNTKIYHNTIHGNGKNGILIAGTNATVKNNAITGNGSAAAQYGLNVTGTLAGEAYNLVTDASTTPANFAGQSNIALAATDLNANPLYTNAAANDFTLQNSSPAINRGVDLVADQPDMNGASAGNFNGYAPDMGYWESSIATTCPVSSTADSGAGTLRACITYANGAPGRTVSFSVSAADAGYQTLGADHWWQIAPASALPTITAAGTIIDGSTQTTTLGNANSLGPEIELNGTGAGSNGLTITGGTTTIRGLAINRFTGWYGIDMSTNGGNTIAGNYIGLIATGTSSPTQLFDALRVNGTANNTIGGTTAADRNVIGGANHSGVYITGAGATGNVVKGNYLGTNATGTAAVGNGDGGVTISTGTGNTIGGTAAGAGNVISGNPGYGVGLFGNSNTVAGNYIGTNAAGTGAVANQYGVLISGATGNTIGGTTANHRNIISGNTQAGVQFTASAASNTVIGNYIGTTFDGTAALGNYWGVYIFNGANHNSIGGTASGQGNLIANSTGAAQSAGVYLTNGTTLANVISGNSIFSNQGIGIDIAPTGVGTGSGANNNKARPTITGIVANGANFDITATVTSGDTIEFFRVNNTASPAVSVDASGSGEGYLFLGSCVDNGACSGPYISGASDANAAAGTVTITLTAAGVSNGDYVTATAADVTNGTSEFAVNVKVPVTISGTVYSGEGSGALAGLTVRLVVNGASAGTAVSNGSGVYSITANVNAGDAILTYIDNDATYKGTTITVANGANLSGIDIYANRIITRHDNGGALTNALMSSAKGAYVDADIEYSVAAGALTVSGTATLYVFSGHSYTPGGNITTPAMKSLGTFNGGANTLTVNGALTVAGGAYTATSATTTIAGDFTVSAGTFTHNSGTVALVSAAAQAVNIGAATLNNATINMTGGAVLTVTGTMTVAGNLTITALGNVTGGTIAVAGDVTTTAASNASTPTGSVLFNGSGAQALKVNGAGGTGAIEAAIAINKPAGTLTIQDTIKVAGDWTWTAGTVNAGTSTVEFLKAATVSSATPTFNNVTLSLTGGSVLTVTGTMTVTGNLSITSLGNVNTGTIAVAGNVTTTAVSNASSPTGTLLLNGSGAQSLSAGGGTGVLEAIVVINKPSGTLTLQDTLQIPIGLTWTAGTVDAGTSTVEFIRNSMTVNTGSMAFNNININSGGATTLTVTGTMTVGANATISAISNINTGTIAVAGNVSTADTSVGGTGNITLNGTGAQTITASVANGDLPNGTVTVNKTSGTATLASDLILNGAGTNVTVAQGTLDLAGYNLTVPATLTANASGTLQLQGGETVTATTKTFNAGSTVIYNGGGTYASLAAGNTYSNLIFNNATGSWTHTGTLSANNLTLTAGTLISGGQNVNVSGNWSNGGTYTSGANTVTLNGTAQSITGNTTFNNFTKSIASAETLTFAAGSTTTINGTATLNGAAGQLLSLRSSVNGTRWNFVLGAGATKAISYVNVKDSDASGSHASKKPINPTNSTDVGNNVQWFAYITIDGNVSEWCDGSGTELCIDDQGGVDDWTSPAKLDITRYGVASNRADTFYILFGFDDTSLANAATACVLMDTDAVPNGNIDRVVCAVINGGPTTVSSVELYTCDDTIAGGCNNPVLAKTYTGADYALNNSTTGPFGNNDTFIEMAMPYTDLGLGGSNVIFTSLISYPGKTFLNAPKDSIFGNPAQNYNERVQYDLDGGSGSLAGNPGAPVIAGYVYSDEGSTVIGSGKTVRLIKNGASVGTDVTDSSGGYYFTTTVNTNDALMVYIDGNDGVTDDATSVTVSNGTSLTDLDLYVDHLITRHDNAGALSIANMNTAKGAYSDTEILYSVSGGNLTVSGGATVLYVPSAHTYTPGANVTTPAMKSLGTFNGGSGSITAAGAMTIAGGTYTATSATTTIGGDFTVSAGTFSANGGTVTFNSGDKTVNIGAAILNHTVINQSAASNLTVTGTMDVNGDLTITAVNNLLGGTITAAGNVTSTDSGVFGSAVIRFDGAGAQTLSASGGSGGISAVDIAKGGGTLTIQDTILVGGSGGWTWTSGTVDAGTSTVEFTNSNTVNAAGMSFNHVVVNMGAASALTVTGNMDINGNLTLTQMNNVNNGSITLAGNLTSTDASVGGTTAITLDGSGAQLITAIGADLPNGTLTINKASGTATLASNLTLNSAGQDLTVTAGTLDLAGFNLVLTAAGDVLTVANGATLKLQGGETVTATTKTFNAGSTVIYNGGGTYASLAAGNTYSNLIFNNATGSWTHTGTLSANNLTLTAGTLISGGQNVNVSGNWSNSGTYTSGANTVTFNGTGQSLTGNTTFNNFTKSVASADTLTFAAGSTTTINGTATLNGAAGQLLSLRSSSTPTRWNFVLGAGATKTISYVDVQDSDASGSAAAQKPVSPTNSTDSGNTISWFSNLAIVKQVWEENGSAALISPVTAPVGRTLVFLIYVKNTAAGAVSDVRINDNLDEAGFQYVAGSLFRTDAATPPTDAATDLAIFNATAPGTGTNLSDTVDADVASALDTGGLTDVDKITVGAVTGQANSSLSIAGHTTFALRFKVKVK